MPKYAPLSERFWRHVRTSDGCWEWTGYRNDGGYGQLGGERSGPAEPAHRVSYRIHYGTFDGALDVLHSCDNPACVRPDHLFLGTALINVRDMMAKGRARNAKREWTHCPRGHALTPDNLKARGDGRRRCLACARLNAIAWREKNPERYRELARRAHQRTRRSA